VPFDKTAVNILGTEYKIIVKDYDEEESFERRGICGFCDRYAKEIIVCDMKTYDGWDKEDEKTIEAAQKSTLRHEIIHAFLFESGLAENSCNIDAWATNEEMVDWFALQGLRIYNAWQETNAI
jgi:hypothetical protein